MKNQLIKNELLLCGCNCITLGYLYIALARLDSIFCYLYIDLARLDSIFCYLFYFNISNAFSLFGEKRTKQILKLHLPPCKILKNSALVFEFVSKHPRTEDVVVMVPVFCTPRMTIQ